MFVFYAIEDALFNFCLYRMKCVLLKTDPCTFVQRSLLSLSLSHQLYAEHGVAAADSLRWLCALAAAHIPTASSATASSGGGSHDDVPASGTHASSTHASGTHASASGSNPIASGSVNLCSAARLGAWARAVVLRTPELASKVWDGAFYLARDSSFVCLFHILGVVYCIQAMRDDAIFRPEYILHCCLLRAMIQLSESHVTTRLSFLRQFIFFRLFPCWSALLSYPSFVAGH
jgi:hypothetical protein